jgi:hypothetical protein
MFKLPDHKDRAKTAAEAKLAKLEKFISERFIVRHIGA